MRRDDRNLDRSAKPHPTHHEAQTPTFEATLYGRVLVQLDSTLLMSSIRTLVATIEFMQALRINGTATPYVDSNWLASDYPVQPPTS